jgi:hypothetical protein
VQATTEDAAFHVLNVQKYGGFILHTGQTGYGTLKVNACQCLPHAPFGLNVLDLCASGAHKSCTTPLHFIRVARLVMTEETVHAFPHHTNEHAYS